MGKRARIDIPKAMVLFKEEDTATLKSVPGSLSLKSTRFWHFSSSRSQPELWLYFDFDSLLTMPIPNDNGFPFDVEANKASN